jgi:hypothetical protein
MECKACKWRQQEYCPRAPKYTICSIRLGPSHVDKLARFPESVAVVLRMALQCRLHISVPLLFVTAVGEKGEGPQQQSSSVTENLKWEGDRMVSRRLPSPQGRDQGPFVGRYVATGHSED